MSIFDIVLLVILGVFVVSGLFKGLIRLLGRVVGLIVGAYVASHFYLAFYGWAKTWGWLESWATDHENFAKVLAFIILFVLVTRLTDLLFLLIEKIFKFIAVIPGSKYINNLLGAALGFLEGSLFLGLILYVVSRYALIGNFFGDQLATSAVAPFLLKIVNIILPILPEALKALKALI
ncbi:MAG: CvpA family protein [Patescibacteria group bacterium]|jgi:membrane protein required for colicin V production